MIVTVCYTYNKDYKVCAKYLILYILFGARFMDIIKKIKIENIKGKDSFEMIFDNLTANQPNIVVAPNGYGKSTVTTAIKAAIHGKLKLDLKDIYKQNPDNHPKLEIELMGNHAGTFISSDTESNLSSNLTLGVINSSLYAKSTTKRYSTGGAASTADLRIEDIVICSKIPERCTINYLYTQIKGEFGQTGKLFLNISEMISNYDNVVKILAIKDNINKCISQQKIQRKFNDFLNKCPQHGTISEIKNAISLDEVELLRDNDNIAVLFDCINEMSHKPVGWQDIDVVFTAIQLCKVIKNHYDSGERDIIKKVHMYLEYCNIRDMVDARLEDFNTTGRIIKTKEDHGKLIVKFERAAALSNGERDILSFIVNITKFENSFKKDVGILIIDEVFDYLDGSNMLAVQYYLTELIKNCKNKNKLLFPIIFTHLDPDVFSNYYFNKKKIHYVSFSSVIDLNSHIVKMLRLRESSIINDAEKEEIEKFFLHYIDQSHILCPELAIKISQDFSNTNLSFREILYSEITEKYLHEENYNPIMVIAGVRIKIEEILYHQLSVNDQPEYLQKHKAINKMNYANEKGIDVPELYYLLQPLYNDGMHLRGNDEAVRSKIKSCYLKTNNMHIKRMIEKLFE